MEEPVISRRRERDALARILEAGLIVTVIVAPLPFGAVVPGGRLGLELGAFVLGALWLIRATIEPTLLPPVLVRVGLAGLILLGLLQIVPVGRTVTSWLSPRSLELRQESLPTGEALEAERRLVGVESDLPSPSPTLSLAPDGTASALRTGAALAMLLLVATTVAATSGLRPLAVALLVSAAVQALYGILVLASGHAMIWHIPKRYYLDSATGTFVNRNHFAGFLAAALPCGLALAAYVAGRMRSGPGFRQKILDMFGTEGNRTLFLGLLLVVGVAGLLLSFSRAGIAVGLAALILTALAAGRRGLKTRIVVVLLVLGIAAAPLAQVGADRLAARYAEAGRDLASAGSRGTVWKDTVRMALDFPWVGTGFGTFASSYPLYRSAEVRLFYDYAHNDWLQAASEGGLLGVALLALVTAPVVVRMVRLLGGGGGTVAAGFAAGLAAMLVHALVDFNFHIPSNAAVAVILAGAVLGTPWNARR